MKVDAMVEVLDVGEQSMRRMDIMEADSKGHFLDEVTKRKEGIVLLKKERGIPENKCLCGRKIELGRLKLKLPNCKICAFGSRLFVSQK